MTLIFNFENWQQNPDKSASGNNDKLDLEAAEEGG